MISAEQGDAIGVPDTNVTNGHISSDTANEQQESVHNHSDTHHEQIENSTN